MAFETVHHLPLADRTRLPYRQRLAEAPRGVVQICHGLAEHGARYRRFAEALAQNGYHAYVQDHRGHGVNIGAHAPKGMIAQKLGHDVATGDVAALNAHIRRTHPGLAVVLFGHSMGGLIALNTLISHPETADAAAVWNANFGDGLTNRTALALLYMERMLKGSDVPGSLLPKLTFRAWGKSVPHHRTLFDWLSRDGAEVDAYIADPLCGLDPTVALWIDIFRMMQRGADDANFRNILKNMPFHLIGGTDDPATDKGEAVRRLAERLRGMGFHDVTCTLMAGTRHESLNDRDRGAVTQNFLDWLAQTLPSVPLRG